MYLLFDYTRYLLYSQVLSFVALR